MTSTRIINPGSKYEVTVCLFQRFQIFIQPPATPQIFFFLVPFIDRPSSPVTWLRWADEFPSLSYCRPLPASAFERLKSLELCFTPSPMVIGAYIADLEAAYIRAAPSLRHLKLCIEHGHRGPVTDTERLVLGPGLALASGCNLRSLALVAVLCEPDVLLGAIKANKHSLRHLYLDTNGVSQTLIRRLAQFRTLKLGTMQIVDE